MRKNLAWLLLMLLSIISAITFIRQCDVKREDTVALIAVVCLIGIVVLLVDVKQISKIRTSCELFDFLFFAVEIYFSGILYDIIKEVRGTFDVISRLLITGIFLPYLYFCYLFLQRKEKGGTNE